MSTSSTETRVRIAPSPTGDPHIGTGYIGLFNYIFAKSKKGKFILRIEDTDRKRYKSSSETQILESLKWLGLKWDEGPDISGKHGPYRQSERKDIYQKYSHILLEKNHAYYCFCSPQRLEELRKSRMAQKLPSGYDGLCRNLPKEDVEQKLKAQTPYVIRMKMPKEGKTIFQDRIRGKIEFINEGIDDQVLLKGDGFPTYHLAVVVDDHLMKITHVIRGEEWISSTPKHIKLYEMFGWQLPEFIHLPLLRNQDKSKISKRKNPTSISYYKRKGILPDTLRNFLALMGWNLGDNREKFSTQEMIDGFTWDRMTLGGPVFDLKKLSWLNSQYLKEKSDLEWLELLNKSVFNQDYLLKIIPLIKERVEKLEDFVEQTQFFFSGDLSYSVDDFSFKKLSSKDTQKHLSQILALFEDQSEWQKDSLHELCSNYLKDHSLKAKELFLPIRIAVTGVKESPPLFDTLETLGKDMVQRRLRLACHFLKNL